MHDLCMCPSTDCICVSKVESYSDEEDCMEDVVLETRI